MSRFRFQASLALGCVLACSSAMAERSVQIISEGKSGIAWTPTTALSEPGYPPGVDAATGDVCVNIGYYLGADGVPSEFAHLRSWSDPGRDAGKSARRLDVFEQAAVAALMQWRFAPAPGFSEPQPIYTSATFVFSADPNADKARVRRHCSIHDLGVFVLQAQKHADADSWEQIRWNGDWFHAKNTRIHGLNRE